MLRSPRATNTNAPTYMIAEGCAMFVLGRPAATTSRQQVAVAA